MQVSESGELMTSVTERERAKMVSYANSSISATKYVALVDLSDTTNFPHTQTGRIDFTYWKIAIDRGNTSVGFVRIGVISRIDGTDADIHYLFNVPFDKSDTRRILSINNIGSGQMKFGIDGGVLQDGITNSADTSLAAVNTGVTLDSPRGTSTVTPAVGDIILKLEHSSGNAWSLAFEACYHSESTA